MKLEGIDYQTMVKTQDGGSSSFALVTPKNDENDVEVVTEYDISDCTGKE